MINVNHLRAFYVCALHKNVTRAADELDVSQPSISQQIKAFEAELGFELFYRNGRTLDLTAEGKILFQKSQTIFESLIGIEDFVHKRPEISSQITLGISHEIERPFAAKITAELINCSLLREAQFSVLSLSESEMNEGIKKGSCEFILSHAKPTSSLTSVEFNFPVKLISKKQNHEISQAKQGNLKALLAALGQKLLIPSPQMKLRKELEENVALFEIATPILMESNILACLTEGIREGAGCGLLPIQYVFDDIKKSKLSIYGPANGFWTHKIYLTRHKSANTSIFNEIKRIIQRFTLENGG
jgi:DNA-binding transcriptional LysR family regulator